MIKNAIAYITRKRNRTLIIFIILTIVLSCLYSCLTIMKSSNEIEKALYESSNSSISITKKDGKYFNVNQFKDIEKLKEIEEKIIQYDEVDTEKIILGIPFYTRQWTIASDGKIKDRSPVPMMNIKIPNNVEKQWDEDLKQYYIEYASGKNTIKMWIEDGTSIKEKVALVAKYKLGGKRR